MKFDLKLSDTEKPIHESDGKRCFFVEKMDINNISSHLIKHNIIFTNEGICATSEIGELYYFVSDSKEEDIMFALEDCIKLLRPYPKG
ncbi:hypothetical protein [Geminisphaera colitermitum]|uniref:hypothetical protein n=1 Tax=Geminisphaera colitermitum TaxID=1148786 RepID=UPI0012FF1E15|nr:hypothetical protein [Geminisphaera colitermitum]